MALTLLLFIPDLPRFDAATSARWTLLDAGAAVLRAGDSPLSAVPHADRVVAVAPVNQLLFIETAPRAASSSTAAKTPEKAVSFAPPR